MAVFPDPTRVRQMRESVSNFVSFLDGCKPFWFCLDLQKWESKSRPTAAALERGSSGIGVREDPDWTVSPSSSEKEKTEREEKVRPAHYGPGKGLRCAVLGAGEFLMIPNSKWRSPTHPGWRQGRGLPSST